MVNKKKKKKKTYKDVQLHTVQRMAGQALQGHKNKVEETFKAKKIRKAKKHKKRITEE